MDIWLIYMVLIYGNVWLIYGQYMVYMWLMMVPMWAIQCHKQVPFGDGIVYCWVHHFIKDSTSHKRQKLLNPTKIVSSSCPIFFWSLNDTNSQAFRGTGEKSGIVLLCLTFDCTNPQLLTPALGLASSYPQTDQIDKWHSLPRLLFVSVCH